MILGLSSFTYGWSVGVPGSMPDKPVTAIELLQRVIQFGFGCLQIGDNLPLHTLSKEELTSLRDIARQHRVRIEVGARKLTAEHLQKYIDLAIFFDSPLLRFVVDGEQYEPDSATIVNIVRTAMPKLKKHRITLGIENHDRFKALELAAIMEAIDEPLVGICLDCVNSIGAGEGLEHVSQVLARYTVNLHIKDFVIERLPHKMGFHVTGAPAGKGMTNLAKLIDILSKHDRCQSAILEQWVTPESTIAETVNTEERWARESIQYLKGLPYFIHSELKIIR